MIGKASLIMGMALAWAMPLRAAEMDVRAPYSGTYTLPVTSLKEARFRTTVPQRYDFSCGSAATATLLSYQYGVPVNEEQVFVKMYTHGD
ncbi:MAG: hypothetical protein ABWY94_00815, partial [Pseudoxanthomonas sp.]